MTDREARLSQLGILIKPTSADCNLRCEYCFYLPKLQLYPDATCHAMPPEVLDSLIRQYMQMSGEHPSFGWQGGEPTMLGVDFFRRVVALQAMHARRGQAIANGFQTNGILITDEWARLFRRYNFLVGLSLDGPQHIHDHYRHDPRGRGTWEQVMATVEVLRRNEVEFNILCMVTAHSAEQAEAIYDFFLRHNLRFVQFIPCVERDPETGQFAPYSASPRQYGEFLCAIFDRWSAETPPKTYVRDMDDLLMWTMTGETPTCIFRQSCGDYLLVEHNGDVYPCDFFVEPEWKLGNLMETPLREIALSDRFEEFRRGKSCHTGRCAACEWLPNCHGGCQRHRYAVGGPGNPVGPNGWDTTQPSHFCKAYRMLFQHSQGRLRQMAREMGRGGG